jgi:histidinol-phosphatase (PHP family)
VAQCIEIVNAFDLDVVGGAVHFLDGQDVVSRRSAWARGEISANAVYPKYLEVLESMLDYDYIDVVCHLDLPKKYNQRLSSSALEDFMGVLEKVRKKDRVVELNTSGFHYPVKEAFPLPELLGRCAQLHIRVVTGFDAHTPETVGGEFDRARDMLSAGG